MTHRHLTAPLPAVSLAPLQPWEPARLPTAAHRARTSLGRHLVPPHGVRVRAWVRGCSRLPIPGLREGVPFMRLLHPLHNLRRHSTTAFEETRFAVCQASPFNDQNASASTTGHDLFGSSALLSERRDDQPSLCPSPSVRPVESGRPRQNRFSRLRPRPTTSEHPPDHPAGSSPRLTSTAPTATFAHTKTTLVMGTVALLALMAMACGSSDAPSTPNDDQPAAVAQVQQDQNDNQTKPSEPSGSSATDTRDREGNQQTGESTQARIHRKDAWGLVTEGMRSVDDGLQCPDPAVFGRVRVVTATPEGC